LVSLRNTDVDYGMRFVVISEKDEVLRISHAVMSELFDRKLRRFPCNRVNVAEAVPSGWIMEVTKDWIADESSRGVVSTLR